MVYTLPDFKVATECCLDDIDTENEDELVSFYASQDALLESLGIPIDKEVTVHFFNSAFFDEHECEEESIKTAIEHLAIKDGIDLVKFDNGNYGFVAYYNCHENAFEIVKW